MGRCLYMLFVDAVSFKCAFHFRTKLIMYATATAATRNPGLQSESCMRRRRRRRRREILGYKANHVCDGDGGDGDGKSWVTKLIVYATAATATGNPGLQS